MAVRALTRLRAGASNFVAAVGALALWDALRVVKRTTPSQTLKPAHSRDTIRPSPQTCPASCPATVVYMLLVVYLAVIVLCAVLAIRKYRQDNEEDARNKEEFLRYERSKGRSTDQYENRR